MVHILPSPPPRPALPFCAVQLDAVFSTSERAPARAVRDTWFREAAARLAEVTSMDNQKGAGFFNDCQAAREVQLKVRNPLVVVVLHARVGGSVQQAA